MGSFSIWHWLIVLVVVLIIFGPGKLPDIGKALGKGIRGFKSSVNSDEGEKEVTLQQAKEADKPKVIESQPVMQSSSAPENVNVSQEKKS